MDGVRAAASAGLVDLFSELSRIPLHPPDKHEVLSMITSICVHALGPDVAVSVFLGEPSSPKHVGWDCGRAQELDGAQMVAAEGPSFTAWETGATVTTEDLRSDSRWPHLAERIGRAEVGMAMAVPVLREDRGGGVLNLYARPGRLLDDEESRVAGLVADTLAAVLQEMDEKAELETLADQLQEALQSRAVIDQAKGMIMLREHCDADAAFRRLVELSSKSIVKLREVARHIVDGTTHR